MNNTKVVVTIGPNSSDENTLRELFCSGMDVARINMSFCTKEECIDIIDKIDKLNEEYSKKIATMIDLDGPRVRVNNIDGGEAYLEEGDKIRVYTDNVLGDKTKFSVNYANLTKDVKVNDLIKIDDGKITLKIIDIGTNYILCEVIIPGVIKTGKTVNVPGRKLNIPFLQAKDKETVEFASAHGIDFLSLSFVRNSDDVLSVTDMLIELGNDHMEVLSKIENNESYEDIDEILKISDGAIVARGDLGVEVPMENIPLMQKNIINKCHLFGKVVIVSTDFLSSIENDMMPTRAEVSDVANAVLDGTDAIMLSGETTVGKHPVEVLKIMERIIKATETGMPSKSIEENTELDTQDITGSVAYSVAACASKLSAVAIVTPTISGYTAKKIGKLRSNCPVVAISPSIDTVKSLALHYGVQPVLSDGIENFDDIINMARDCTKAMMKVNEGDKIIITGGYPFSKVKHTNFMKIEEL